MGWSDADALGVGESSQGMDANPVGGGLGADEHGNIFDRNYESWHRYNALLRARLGLPASPNMGYVGSGLGNPFGELTEMGRVSNTPHNSQLSFVDLMDPNLQDPMGGGVGATPAGGYSFGGMTPQNSDGGLISDGGGERPWWLEGTNNGMGMMNPATGGWNDWDSPYTGVLPPNNTPPQLEVNPGMPYIRPTRPKLAYENAYDQWDEQGGFGGGM